MSMNSIKLKNAVLSVAILIWVLLVPSFAQAQLADAFYRDQVDKNRYSDQVNLSHYVYHDRNRNGDYDLGDIPASGIYVLLHKNGRIHAQSQTNENGYANFVTSSYPQPDKVDIYDGGEYEFEVIVPNDWQATSENARQPATIVENSERRTGLYLSTYLRPVGIAQNNWLRGKLPNSQAGTVKLYQAQKLVATANAKSGAHFQFDVPEGEYQLRFGNISQSVSVEKFPSYIGVLGASKKGLDLRAQKILGTFDDLSGIQLYKIPNGYLGLNWKDTNIIRRDFGNGGNLGYANGVVSGEYVAYSTQARSIEFSHPQGFDLESVYLSQAWPKAEGQLVEITAFNGDQLVLKDKIKLSYLGPIKYAPKLANITKLVLNPLNSWQIIMDDLVIEHK